MFCPYCGGEYANWAQKCPYCGSVNEQADESLYLQHLNELRQRLDRVDEESELVYRTQISGSVKRVLKRLGVLLAVAAVLTIVLTGIHTVRSRKAEQQRIDQMTWERQEFAQLDIWYASGDYDRILEENSAVLREGRYHIFDWPHYYFVCDYYRDHMVIQTVSEMIRMGEKPESYDLGEAIYAGMKFLYEMTDAYIDQLRHSYDANGAFGLTEEEAEQVRNYRQEAESFFRDTLGWSDNDLQEFRGKVIKDGYTQVTPCFKYAEQLIKEWK